VLLIATFKFSNIISNTYLKKLFSKFLRSHFPELKFEIVFISKSWNDSVDEENNITTIREMPKNKISDYKVAGSQIEELLNNKFYCYK
jgi:hypothetical protein